jgi:poly(3-hydroxybutyrate) depolymerase
MVRTMVKVHGLDADRLFVNGLSAGGAMTAVMLACYPDLFAGGAIIAGLAFGIADNVPEALERMRGQGMPSRRALASRIVNAADHDGTWPTLSVWHGTADHIVSNANADIIVDQWRDRVGLGDVTGEVDAVEGQRRTSWRDARGRALIERYDIAGMGHGTPLGDGECGQTGPHMLDAGICSTRRIAESWGLTATHAGAAASKNAAPAARPEPRVLAAIKPSRRKRPVAARPTCVAAVIEDALRASGLMR